MELAELVVFVVSRRQPKIRTKLRVDRVVLFTYLGVGDVKAWSVMLNGNALEEMGATGNK